MHTMMQFLKTIDNNDLCKSFNNDLHKSFNKDLRKSFNKDLADAILPYCTVDDNSNKKCTNNKN